MANSHRRRNLIKKIKINGIWFEEKATIRGAYQDFLSDLGGWRPSISSLSFKEIGRDVAPKLEDPFIVEEVFTTLSYLNGDKAPGPDGFSIALWLFNWDFVKEEIMGFFNEFHENNMFVRSLNSTFLVLVPKNENAVDIKDFRPISLVGGLYKILAKVLANRLKKVVGQIVSISQNAFVEGQQILDATLITNEAVDFLIRRKERGFLCKLDIEKAYDLLNWDLLLEVMEKIGFGRNWLIWIRWCISTTFFFSVGE